MDEIFNVKEVNTNFLTYGSGIYRVYAAFCDVDGDVLVCSDSSMLEVSYEFIVDM